MGARPFNKRKDPSAAAFAVAVSALLMVVCPLPASMVFGWEKIQEGLYFGEFDPNKRSSLCDDKIVIVKIDPAYYSFRLLCASERGRRQRTLGEWAREFGLQAAINASMYQSEDLLNSTGYMKNHEHLNNPQINRRFGSLMLFNPVDPSLPEVQMIDRRNREDWKGMIDRYHCVVQNYRMISDGVKRGWAQQETMSGIAAVGMDRDRHVLFILSRAPYSVYDFIDILLALPIDIQSAMYVEGGPRATLHVKAGERERTFIGLCSDHVKGGAGKPSWEIPNVIGIVKGK